MIFICVFLLSCCASNAVSLPKRSYIRCGETGFDAEYDGEKLFVSFSEPSLLNGISMTVSENGAVADIYGAQYALTGYALEKPNVLYGAMSALRDASPVASRKEGNTVIYTYLLDGKEYLVYYNTETREAVGLDACGLHFEITGVNK